MRVDPGLQLARSAGPSAAACQVCDPRLGSELLPRENTPKSVMSASKGIPLTLASLREKRSQGLWCCAYDDGEYTLAVKSVKTGEKTEILCCFAEEGDIDFMVSYRWKDFFEVLENGTQIAVNFREATSGKGKCWVDSLNHLNDPELKTQVVEGMGTLYSKHCVIAQYFESPAPQDMFELFTLLAEATRGWMWQEVVLSKGVRRFGSNTARLCFLLLQLGRDWFLMLERRADCDPHRKAMINAVKRCALHDVDRFLKRCDRAEWAAGEVGAVHPSEIPLFTVLLDVPDSSVAAMEEVVKSRDERERTLMSAASNLMNSNIGYKADVGAASLAVLSARPEFGGGATGTLEGRCRGVLQQIRKQMLQSALEHGQAVWFEPVPYCGDPAISDLFELRISSLRFVALDLVPSLNNSTGSVQIRREGARDFEEQEYRVSLIAEDEYLAKEKPVPTVGEEQEVSSVWVSLKKKNGRAVDIFVTDLFTASGIRLNVKSDTDNFTDFPGKQEEV